MIKNEKKNIWRNFSPVVVILIILLSAVILGYLIPSGEYVHSVDPNTGANVIQEGSYHKTSKPAFGFLDIFVSIHTGFVSASDIIFLCVFACFYLRVISSCNALAGGICALRRRLKGKDGFVLAIFILAVSFSGFSYGELEGIYPLIPMFVSATVMMGYDAIVGIAISGGAVLVGFASSAFNPYTIGVAQQIAGLPLYSGAVLRGSIYFCFSALLMFWTLRYSRKIKDKPINSLLYGEEMEKQTEEPFQDYDFGLPQKLTLVGFFLVIIVMVYGTAAKGWYFGEVAALFLLAGIVNAILLRYNGKQITDLFIDGFKDILVGAVVIGLARSILVVLDRTIIIDTIVYYIFLWLKELPKAISACGMVVAQTFLNLFIPSGSGQAAAVMPIMLPLADLLGINRQVAVLAFQMGDGFSNMLWPTCPIMVICSIAKVPYSKWLRFFLPLFFIYLLMMFGFILLAMNIGYGPF